MLELIREKRTEEALDFAQEHLSEKAETLPDVVAEMESTMALLAFDDPMRSPFAELMDLAHRRQLASGEAWNACGASDTVVQRIALVHCRSECGASEIAGQGSPAAH